MDRLVDEDTLNLTRRRLITLGVIGAAWVVGSAIPGCAPLGRSLDSSEELPDVGLAKVQLLNVKTRKEDPGVDIGRLIVAQGRLSSLGGKIVCIQSSFLSRHEPDVLLSYLRILASVADALSTLGARRVVLSTDSLKYQSGFSQFVVEGPGVDNEKRRSVHASTRLEGRLRFEIPQSVHSADVVISMPLSSASGMPLLASTNLLGLLAECEHSTLRPEHLGGTFGDLIVDLVCTIKPQYCINILFADDAHDDSFTAVMGRELSSVDAVSCVERGFDPNQISPLRDVPAWVGPITPELIRVQRFVA